MIAVSVKDGDAIVDLLLAKGADVSETSTHLPSLCVSSGQWSTVLTRFQITAAK